MKRGRHQSTDKEGKKTLLILRNLPGVTAVIIGHSIGGKALGRNATAGHFKLQREVEGGFKGALQTSKGIQEIFIKVEQAQREQVAAQIKKLWVTN